LYLGSDPDPDPDPDLFISESSCMTDPTTIAESTLNGISILRYFPQMSIELKSSLSYNDPYMTRRRSSTSTFEKWKM
jgi:hypothetical protein